MYYCVGVLSCHVGYSRGIIITTLGSYGDPFGPMALPSIDVQVAGLVDAPSIRSRRQGECARLRECENAIMQKGESIKGPVFSA